MHPPLSERLSANVMSLNANGYYPVQVDDEACIACGMCYITCPDGVFTYQEIQKGEVK